MEDSQAVGFDLRNLLHVHRRLLGTPVAEEKRAEAGDHLAGAKAGGRAERGRPGKARLEDLTLDDLYAGSLSPVSLADFENFLLFEEHSVENLYFDAWLRSYTAFFATGADSEKHPEQLVDSTAFAMSTFLHPSSLLELNTTAVIRADLATALALSDVGSLPPAAFAALHAEVRDTLRLSLGKFILRQRGNSGTKRAWLAIAIGLVNFALGWVPCVATAVAGGHRAWRVLGLPFFLFGAWTFYCGLFSTCLMIFLIGGERAAFSRQLWPYEVASLGRTRRQHSASTAHLTHARSRSTLDDLKLSPALTDMPSPAPPVHVLTLDTVDELPPPAAPPLSLPTMPPGLAHFPSPNAFEPARPPRFAPYEAAGGADGLDWSAPAKGASCCAGPAVWGRMVVVESLEVREWQRRVVVRGAMWGIVTLIVAGAVALAVPAKR